MAQKKTSPAKKASRPAASAKKQPLKKAQKKPQAAKKAPVKKISAYSDVKKSLIAKLMVVCRDLDEAGISALIRHGAALIKDMKVQDLLAEKAKKAAARPSTIPARTAPVDKFSVDVTEGSDGSYFMVGINKYRIFFAREEFKKLVRICHLAENAKDAGQRMHNWFKKERGDILFNTKIDGPFDQALATIYNYIVKTYTVKE